MVSILMRRIVAMVLAGLSMTLAACGYKGPLYLPPPASTKPVTPAPGINPATPGTPDTSNPTSPMFEQDPSMTPAPVVISN